MSKAKCSNCELQDANSPFWQEMCVDCNIIMLEAELEQLHSVKRGERAR